VPIEGAAVRFSHFAFGSRRLKTAIHQLKSEETGAWRSTRLSLLAAVCPPTVATSQRGDLHAAMGFGFGFGFGFGLAGTGIQGGGAGLDATLIGPVTRVVSLTSASVGVHPSGMATLPWVLDLGTYVL